MATVSTLLYLILFGSVGGFITILSLGFAGLPGNIIAGKPGVRSITQFRIGTIIAGLGQTYVYLAYCAFIIAWTKARLSDGNSIDILIWVFAFVAVQLPIMMGSAFYKVHDTQKKLPYANPLVEGLYLVAMLTFISFFVFVFAPSSMQALWSWVPFVTK